MRPAVPSRMMKVGTGRVNGHNNGGLAFVLHGVADAELGAGAVRVLVKDGRWCVPVAERPKGWEKLSVRES